MAKQTTTILVDDIDAESEAAETVAFALEGTSYEIDLTEDHASELRADLAVYVGAARKKGGSRRKVRSVSSPSASKVENEPTPEVVRTWASETGIEVSARGRIKASTLRAYLDAH